MLLKISVPINQGSFMITNSHVLGFVILTLMYSNTLQQSKRRPSAYTETLGRGIFSYMITL